MAKLNSLKGKIVEVLKRYGVVRAGVFGSYARGEEKMGSDVDILIEVGDNISLFDFVGIKLELEDELGRKVDLVEYKMIKSRIRDNVLSDEVRII